MYHLKSRSDLGKFGIMYHNVGTYRGKTIDLKITITDYDPRNPSGGIRFSEGVISLDTQDMHFVKQRWDFYDAKTNEKVKINGYITINDIDWSQGVTFDSETSKHIQNVLVTKDTIVDVKKNNGEIAVKDSGYSTDIDPVTKRGWATVLFNDTDNLTFKWCEHAIDSLPYDPDKTKWNGRWDGAYFGYTEKKLARTEIINPEKYIQSNGNNVTNKTITPDDGVVYSLLHKVPDEISDFHYKSYELKDDVPDCLKIKSYGIYNEAGKNVSELFDNETSGNCIHYVAKKNSLEKDSFYGHDYYVKIKADIYKPNLSKYKVNHDAQIKNYFTVTIDGKTKKSNDTIVHTPIPAKLTVRHLDARDNKALASPTTTTKYCGDSYTTSPVDIKGFHVSKRPTNATGTIGTSDVVVTYYYDRDTEHVKANYKSKDGQTLAPSDTYSGLFGDHYHTDWKHIVGYKPLGDPSNKDGIFKTNNPDVNFIYERVLENVDVVYVDTHGNKLADPSKMQIPYGLPYTTSAKTIKGYHLTKVPANATGVGDADHMGTPIQVTYVYDTNPAIQEGINSNPVSSSNYAEALKTTSQSISYNKTYHYKSKVTVGGSMKLNDLKIQTTLGKDVNPILKSGNISSQDIHVYAVNSDGGFTDVTMQGDLQYTVNGKNVASSTNTSTLIDMDKARVVSWKAHTPANFVGKTLVTDIPVQLKPDSTKLSGYKTSSGIKVTNSTSLIENNDIADNSPVRTSTTSVKTLNSNSVNFNCGDIYTIKASKSIFKSNKTIGGKIYLTLSNNLVASNKTTLDKNAVAVSAAGQSKNVDLSLSDNKQIVTVPIDSSRTASQSSPTFGVTVTSNNKNNNTDNIVLASSLIKSETSNNSVTTTVYNDDIYKSSTKAAQYPKANTTGTSAVAPEAVETYYYQNIGNTNSQFEVTYEMRPLYVKLMESMSSQFNPTVSAKAGYGIKNDVVLNYYGRHLNSPNKSVSDFENNNLATTFSTSTDLTTTKGVSSSQIKNNTSELLDYTATDTTTNNMIKTLKGMSASDKSKYLNKIFDANTANRFLYNQNGNMTLDEASMDISKSSSYNSLDYIAKALVDTFDKATNTTPIAPRLYTMHYRFNKRLLVSSGRTKQGIEYYDTSSPHVKNNSSTLANNASASNTRDGGYRFYTNQWLALGNYATTYQSHAFGSNDFVFKLNRDLNIYGHRYLAKGDGATGDMYDDIAIQPVISTDWNSSKATFPSNVKWEDR